jgi:L-threonylcarbamoyladenylate synthase
MSYYAKKIDEKVIEFLRDGRIGLLPTDTIYGLSASALSKDAVEQVHELKERDNRPLIVLIANIEQLGKLGINQERAEKADKYWPAPISVIFESPNIPEWLSMGTASLAVRVPDNFELRNLIKKTGPIVSTSANLRGQEPAKTVKEARKYFGDRLDFYVDAGHLDSQPSTLVKIENNKLKVVRQGAYEIKPQF